MQPNTAVYMISGGPDPRLKTAGLKPAVENRWSKIVVLIFVFDCEAR